MESPLGGFVNNGSTRSSLLLEAANLFWNSPLRERRFQHIHNIKKLDFYCNYICSTFVLSAYLTDPLCIGLFGLKKFSFPENLQTAGVVSPEGSNISYY